MDFANRIVKISQNYKDMRLVFDRCITCSLKSRTKKKRKSGKEIWYRIDDTNIANISLKQLFSHIATQQQLTVYLSEYVISEFERLGIDYVVSYNSSSETN